MKDFDNTNKGALWNNDRKTTDKHPDLNGQVNIEGHEFWVSAWKTAGTNPKAPVLRFEVKRKDSVSPKDYDTSRPTTAPKQDKPVEGNSEPVDDGFDSIPF